MTFPERPLERVTVNDVMHAGILMTDPETPLKTVARPMADRKVHAVAVADTGSARGPLGIISALDIAAAVATWENLTAADASREDVIIVRADERTVSRAELSYDALLVCLGTSSHARYEHATTLDDAHMDELVHGLVQDIEDGYVHRLAIVVPDPVPWPLPGYELSLMASERAWDMQTDLSVTLLTPEHAPLASFGAEASPVVAQLLHERKIEVVTSAQCDIPKAKTIRIGSGDRTLEADRIIALPELRGPSITGLPHDDGGFIPVDQHAAVTGVNHVWAAGDTTGFWIKHGGVAAQMADTAARSIAAFAGAPVTAQTFDPVLEGVLLTGGSPRYLRGHPSPNDNAGSELRKLGHDDQTPKIAATYLAPHLDALSPHLGTP